MGEAVIVNELGVSSSELVVIEMLSFTDYLWFNTKKRQEFVRITDEVRGDRQEERRARWNGARFGDAHHAGVYVNDWEDGLIHDFQVWLEKLAPAGLPYKHHQTGEDNADAHLKRTIMGHQVIVPITGGRSGSRAVGAGVLRRVRRSATKAGRREGDGDVAREERRRRKKKKKEERAPAARARRDVAERARAGVPASAGRGARGRPAPARSRHSARGSFARGGGGPHEH